MSASSKGENRPRPPPARSPLVLCAASGYLESSLVRDGGGGGGGIFPADGIGNKNRYGAAKQSCQDSFREGGKVLGPMRNTIHRRDTSKTATSAGTTALGAAAPRESSETESV